MKAIGLKDWLKNNKGDILPLQKDFKNKWERISIEYSYILSDAEEKEAGKLAYTIQDIWDGGGDQKIFVKGFELSKVTVIYYFNYEANTQVGYSIDYWDFVTSIPIFDEFEWRLKEFILSKVHQTIFWTSEERYLISQPIDLNSFASSPDTVSIPLKNCFLLTGITDISESIRRLAWDSTEIEELENQLWKKVTEHIRAIWPGHPIEITFKINNNIINFHIKDLGTSEKAKTVEQRSDWFHQFISFLLTISAQNKNEELNNTILLVDEPETHLHPKAQENLLKELIKITKKNNNIVFFATHSNYMIDKEFICRNFEINKEKDNTEKSQFEGNNVTYASVNYQVFDIATTDLHNELYWIIEEIDPAILSWLKKTKKWIKINKDKTEIEMNVSLQEYIRHSIHHPENTKNKKFNYNELEQSIEEMISKLI